jgi:hypothetical protein
VLVVVVLVLAGGVGVGVREDEAGVVFCVLAGYYSWEGFVELGLLLFYCVDDGCGSWLSLYWFWEGFFGGLLGLHLVDLLIVYPISAILHFAVLEELSKAMAIVVLEISSV